MGKPHPERTNRIIGVVLAFMLAVTMVPVAGLQAAYADEPPARPATSGGDVALEGTNGEAAAGASQAPVAEEREGGMLAAGGLMYTVADGGLALAGFDGAAPEGALAVPAAVMVDGKETAVVAVDVAEGQVADTVTILSLPQGIKNVNTSSLAPAFPNLLSVEAAAAAGPSLPVASGAASMRAAYSTSGGMLFRPASVAVQTEDGLVESIECKELVWAPPALVSARIPVECRAIAEGAFADARDLKTVVAFGTMERISDGAFSVEQMESAKVVVPQASAAVTDAERVSASMALMGDAGQKERRSAWHEAGWRTDDIVMGKPYGSLTETVAVTEEGVIERTEMQLVSYPGAHENAMDLKKPNADGVIEQAESGLAFTVKSDMTASVTWQGDKTATPAHVDIPASVMIDGVTYPVTEIAAGAFEGATFLRDIAIPEGVTTIGKDAFKDCDSLADIAFPATLRIVDNAVAIKESPSTNLDVLTTMDASGSLGYEKIAENPERLKEGVASSDAESVAFSNDISSFSATDGVTRTFKLVPMWLGSDAPYIIDRVLPDTVVSARGATYTPPTSSKFASVTFDTAPKFINFACSAGGLISVVGGSTAAGGNSYCTLQTTEAWEPGPWSLNGDVVKYWVTKRPLYSVSWNIVTGKPTSFTPSDHTHDAGDVTEGAFGTDRLANAAVTVDKLAGDSVETAKIKDKAVTDDKLASTFVKPTEFGTISYGSSLDGVRDKSVYPTSYRKGGTPAIPEPEKAGQAFEGWSWSRVNAVGGQTVTGDSGNIQSAFAEPGTVTLTARWGTPEADHFFSGGRPLDAAGGAQSHVIKVKLADSQKAVSNLHFKPKDTTGLIRPDAQGGVSFSVGVSESADAGTCDWDGTIAGPVQLADLGGGAWGLYVKVSIPDGAVDQSKVVKSFTGGEYVASLVTLEYAFA